jgi:hypothetical protein
MILLDEWPVTPGQRCAAGNGSGPGSQHPRLVSGTNGKRNPLESLEKPLIGR